MDSELIFERTVFRSFVSGPSCWWYGECLQHLVILRSGHQGTCLSTRLFQIECKLARLEWRWKAWSWNKRKKLSRFYVDEVFFGMRILPWWLTVDNDWPDVGFQSRDCAQSIVNLPIKRLDKSTIAFKWNLSPSVQRRALRDRERRRMLLRVGLFSFSFYLSVDKIDEKDRERLESLWILVTEKAAQVIWYA